MSAEQGSREPSCSPWRRRLLAGRAGASRTTGTPRRRSSSSWPRRGCCEVARLPRASRGRRDEEGALVAKRPALADSVWVDAGWSSPVALAVFRSGTFDPPPPGDGSELREVEVEIEASSLLAELVEATSDEGEGGPSIEEADVIVAGGRGLGGPENFALVEELASALGGAVAAARAGVDAGWYPYSTQVGRTGQTVAPRLYVAVGSSGAIQHKVGMHG